MIMDEGRNGTDVPIKSRGLNSQRAGLLSLWLMYDFRTKA